MGRTRAAAVLTALFLAGGGASAEPLAKELFGAEATASQQRASAIGSYAQGCMAGGVELEWQPYDRVTLEDHVEKGNTVLIDFTADW